jgi:tRNA(Leu) C34 or U34 (ribose-2'-O)-methylase TrmL
MANDNIYGKNAKKTGRAPAVVLVNPRFPHNVGAAVRAASCFGVQQVWWTGDRVSIAMEGKKRLPREERMKGYRDVELRQYDSFLDQFEDVTPVAVELRPNSESLPVFEHPKNPLYIFGPEDGSIPAPILRHCHRFVVIPTRHCVNLAAAVYLVLYDRLVKSNPNVTIADMLNERRVDFPENDDVANELGIVNTG